MYAIATNVLRKKKHYAKALAAAKNNNKSTIENKTRTNLKGPGMTAFQKATSSNELILNALDKSCSAVDKAAVKLMMEAQLLLVHVMYYLLKNAYNSRNQYNI